MARRQVRAAVPGQIRAGFSTAICVILLMLMAPMPGSAHKPEPVTQTGHSGRVNAIAFSPDGHVPASGGLDMNIARRRDDLNLIAAVKNHFYDDLSPQTRGAAQRLVRAVYVPADEMAGAYIPSGFYKVDGPEVTVDMSLCIDDKEFAAFQVTGKSNDLDSLASTIANRIYKALNAL